MAHSLPNDEAMPQLQTLLDATAMADILQACLPTASQPGASIEQAHLERIRYRPAKRVLLLYKIRFKPQSANKALSIWVTVASYADKSARVIHKRNLRFIRGVGLPQASYHYSCYLPSVNAVVQAFPFDRKLPLLDCFAGQLPSAVCNVLLRRAAGDDGKLLDYSLQVSRYRPSYAATFRCRVRAEDATGALQQKQYYLKVLRPQDSLANQTFYELLRAGFAESSDLFRLQLPCHYLPEFSMAVFDQAPGTDVLELLQGNETLDDPLKRVAHAIAALHQTLVFLPNTRNACSVSQRDQRSSQFLQWALPALAPSLRKLVHTACCRNSIILVPSHCDLKAEHLFVGDDKITLIDLDSMAMADPAYDLAILLERLQLMATSGVAPFDRCQLAATVLLRSYAQCVPHEYLQHLDSYRGSAALKVSQFLVQHQIDGWRETVPQLINEALERLCTRSEYTNRRVLA